MSNNSKAEFMQVFTEECSKFFNHMQQLCNAYNQQFGGSGTTVDSNSSFKNSKKKKLSDSNTQIQNSSSKKKSNVVKDPNMPKKPASAYIIYFSERQSKVKEKYQELNVTEISKLIAKDWRELTDAQKRPYLELAVEKQTEYVKSITEYARKNPDLNIKIPGSSKSSKKKEKIVVKEQKKNVLDSSDESERENQEAEAVSDDSTSEGQQIQIVQKGNNLKRKIQETSEESDSDNDSYEQQVVVKKHKA